MAFFVPRENTFDFSGVCVVCLCFCDEVEIFFGFFISIICAVSANLKAMFVISAVERKIQWPFGLVLLCDVLQLISDK